MMRRSRGCGNVTTVLPRSTRLNWISIIWSMASRQNSPSTTIGTAKVMPIIVRAARSGRPAILRNIMTLRGVSRRVDIRFSSHNRRHTFGAAGRMATAGAKVTTRCKAVMTPSEAAAKLIAAPTITDHGVKCEGEVGQAEKSMIARDHRARRTARRRRRRSPSRSARSSSPA